MFINTVLILLIVQLCALYQLCTTYRNSVQQKVKQVEKMKICRQVLEDKGYYIVDNKPIGQNEDQDTSLA